MALLDIPNRLEVGDRLRSFDFTDFQGRPTSLDLITLAGWPMVLHFTGGGENGLTELKALGRVTNDIAALQVPVVAITALDVEGLPAQLEGGALPLAILPNRDGRISSALGTTGDEHALIVGPDLRVKQRLVPEPGRPLADAIVAECRRLTARSGEQIVAAQAPVLLLPHVFPTEFCAKLIDYWNAQEKRNDMVGYGGANTANRDAKRRQDVVVEDKTLLGEIQALLQRRMVYEVHKAFFFAIRKAEPFKIGCYDAGECGWFRPHRDNEVAACAHRRFAMSLMLSDGYDGGEVRFAEYPGTLYKPPLGGALIFSCSLLHEVTPVTKGRRFGLFGFFS
jgi:predicted 2-oxoglutarate/Fe(II)-dependent dioxygenase YbiX